MVSIIVHVTAGCVGFTLLLKGAIGWFMARENQKGRYDPDALDQICNEEGNLNLLAMASIEKSHDPKKYDRKARNFGLVALVGLALIVWALSPLLWS